MKRFIWSLQRVLDVTRHRELGLQSEILSLLQQVSQLRRRIIGRRSALRATLSGLGEASMEHRAAVQSTVMDAAARSERAIATMRQEVAALTVRRMEMAAEIARLRKRKDTLDRMREEARREHVREQSNQEQKRFDEGAQIAFARKASAQERCLETGV